MPSSFVNTGCIGVHDECEFIYGQGSGCVRPKKNMCFRLHGILK